MCGGIPKTFFTLKVDAWLVWLFGGAFALAACAAFFLLWDGDYCAFAAFALFDIFVFLNRILWHMELPLRFRGKQS